ncbi:MAG: flagellar basal body rod protein FlgC [Cyanobacteria bacterium]|nr:flagellar basal body rod protein FlgC [Cyanobacteriota bacterium]
MDVYEITASALTAQRMRLDTISSNLANANSTRRADGSIGGYRRKEVVFAPMMDSASKRLFNGGSQSPQDLASSFPMKPGGSGVSIGPDGRPLLKIGISETAFTGAGVQVVKIQDDTKTPMTKVYDPNHPDADKTGYVEMPNINVVKEMIDMISANRAYEANVTSLQSAKSMQQTALQI